MPSGGPPQLPRRKIEAVKTSVPDSRTKRVRLTAEKRGVQLLDIAEELFTQRGYEGVSIEDIARAANVTRPVVYQHYGSREGVFLACVARARSQFEQSILERVSAADDDIADQIRAGGGPYFDLIEDDPKKFVLLFTASASQHGDLGDGLSALRTGTIHAIAAVIRKRWPNLKPEAALAFAYSASGIGEQLGRWWLTKPSMPKRRILAYYIAAVEGAFHGIADMSAARTRTRP